MMHATDESHYESNMQKGEIVMKAEVVLKVSPAELQVLKRALFVYGEVLRRNNSVCRDILSWTEERYGTSLTASLPIPMAQAVSKTLNEFRSIGQH